jgi:hypothetical protein
MELNDALSQVAEIHRHLLRSEVYRGYRSPVMAVTSAVAFAAAALQSRLGYAATPADFVRFWLCVAAANLLLVSLDVALEYYPSLSTAQQRNARSVIAQFLPSLCAGAVVTWGAMQAGSASMLPGVWCVLFSLGVFASRPYLPQGIGWVGLFYLLAGTLLLALVPAGHALRPWDVGLAFGVGQAFLAGVLYWNLERSRRHER